MPPQSIIFILILGITNINCLLNENIRSESILYGISSIVSDEDNVNCTSKVCCDQLRQFYNGVNEKKVWALKLLDSSGIPGDGFLYGNNLWSGSEFQCRDATNRKEIELYHIERPLQDGDFPPYELKYQMAYIIHNSTLQKHTRLPFDYIIQAGLCLPEICTTEEITDLLKIYLERNYLIVQNLYDLNLTVEYLRYVENDTNWIFYLPKTIILCTIIGLVLLLTIIGTIYDELYNKQNGDIEIKQNGNPIMKKPEIKIMPSILSCFNFNKNLQILLQTQQTADSVTCIHGIRFWGMIWVIMVHSSFFISEYLENVPTAYRLSESFLVQPISNSTYCVDTFFFLGGFLLSYLFYKSKKKIMEENKPLRPELLLNELFMNVFNRFLRLTPAYGVVLLSANVLYTFAEKNAVLRTSEDVGGICDQYWWRNLIYINNFFPRTEMCLSWSYYLSNDMQMFTVSMAIVLLSLIMFKLAMTILGILLAICIVSTALQSYHVRYIPYLDQQLLELDSIYDFPWNRIGPYLVGVVTGYILQVKLYEKELVFKKRTKAILWTVFPLINLYIVFAIYTREVSVEFSAIYMALSRTFWGVGIAWLVFACRTGNAGILNDFLSFGGFVPFSRLTYCAYLLNPLVTKVFMWGSSASFKYSFGFAFMTFFATTFTTFFIAFFFYILFESPFSLLTKLLFDLTDKKKKSNRVGDEITNKANPPA